ncbi:hypothetical protein QYF36_017937 [Acer negundo]|nr:hypothetical protein QYF36_017937 [Acer negundo]
MAFLSSVSGISRQQLSCSSFKTDVWNICRLNSWHIQSYRIGTNQATQLYKDFSLKMCSVSNSSSSNVSIPYEKSKRVWIWTESKLVMCAAVERGWNTFIFSPHNHELANDWSSMALIDPLFIKEGEVFDRVERRVATIFELVDSPQLSLRGNDKITCPRDSNKKPTSLMCIKQASGRNGCIAIISAVLKSCAIPLEIGSLKNLVSLYLSGNNLIGPIPSTLGRLTKLRDLDLPVAFACLQSELKSRPTMKYVSQTFLVRKTLMSRTPLHKIFYTQKPNVTVALDGTGNFRSGFRTNESAIQLGTSKTTIVIKNNFHSNANSLYVHCRSKDDDIGEHWLTVGQTIVWSFHENAWSTTLFHCYAQWGNQKKYFNA